MTIFLSNDAWWFVTARTQLSIEFVSCRLCQQFLISYSKCLLIESKVFSVSKIGSSYNIKEKLEIDEKDVDGTVFGTVVC